ncbi:MAG: hypothetical protein ABIN74_05960, partial [Ferruginibacter sp.]
MKQLFFFFFIGIALQATATVRTVSNTPSTVAQFNTIQSAINVSTAGDTIYIHGSPNLYGPFTQTNIQLTFIGPGFSADKNLSFNAQVVGCNIIGAACANSEYQGIAFVSTVAISNAHPDNLRFIRNHFFNMSIGVNQGATTYSGYLFEGNLFDNSSADATSSSTYQNFLFQNNYFFENGTVRDGNINGGWVNCINVLFDHNLWFGPGSGTRNITDGNTQRFFTFTNNIFVRRNFNGRVSSSV